MTRVEKMTQAYIAAIYFTDTGDNDQPETDAELTPLCKAQAFIDCRNFMQAISGVCGEPPVKDLDHLDPVQLGHDLWLTRNGHGVSFLDRIPMYSNTNAVLFCRLARAIGDHDAEFLEKTNEESRKHPDWSQVHIPDSH